MSDRLTQMKQWLNRLGYRDYSLVAASEDASFRSYLRLQTGDESLIVMDAPPERESCDSFIAVAQKLRDAGLNAPEVFYKLPKADAIFGGPKSEHISSFLSRRKNVFLSNG